MNILLVDDDATNRLVLSSILKQEGYTVLAAENGANAVELFESNKVDLVLMDIMMPVMDGYQASIEIKSRTIGRFVPIIFLTAITDELALAKCVECGGDDFLTKPYNRVILRSKINALNRISELYNTIQDQNSRLNYFNQKIEEDIALAKHVYDSILSPQKIYQDIFKIWMQPVSGFNGDLFLANKTIDHGYHVMIGDFTGHGIAASLGTIPVADIFNGMTERGYRIADIVIEINNRLNKLLPTGYFCAAAFLSIDCNGSMINVLNAGLPPIIVKYDKDRYTEIKSQHLPLGVISISKNDLIFTRLDIEHEADLIVATDGLIETKTNSGDLYGYARLAKIVLESSNYIDDIKRSVEEYLDTATQEDDITLLHINLPIESDFHNAGYVKESYEWSYFVELEAEQLKRQEIVMTLLETTMLQQIPSNHKDRIFTIINEIFNNSLEHGILQLDSKMKSTPEGFSQYYSERSSRLEHLTNAFISLNIHNKPLQTGGELEIEVKDSGSGFNFSKCFTDNTNDSLFSGRGIMLVRTLCKEITYLGQGNEVKLIYQWDYDSDH